VPIYEPEDQQSSQGSIAHEVGELHRLLVESVQDYAIFALDPHGYILSWNAGAQGFKGYTASEIIGKHFSIFYPPEKIARKFPEQELEIAARTGRFEDEGWRIRKDGTRFWADVVITALRDENGELLGYAKVTRDVTERRKAEDKLRESEERFRLMIENVKDYAIFMLDPNGYVATWNQGAERIKGWKANEIIGKHFSIFYPEEDKKAGKTERELEIATATGKYEEEGWRVRKDGTQFWANILITAIRGKNGDLRGFAKITRDLTERRAAQQRAIEDARRVASEETARRVAEERQNELTEIAARLRSQARELEAANLTKAQFLASMSHELRTPLNAIGGYVDLLMMGVRGPMNDEQMQDLERVRRSQQHLLAVITDILNFSRVEAGQLTYEIVRVPILEVVKSVTQMVIPQASAKGLSLGDVDCPKDLDALADRSKVEQILLNLLSNAVKFTPSGGSVTVACRRDGNRALMSVTDTGMGIPEDHKGKIFEPFVQIGRSLTSAQEGTGLGLAISRDLARAMGGDITVESTLGEGSTFTLSLPRDLHPGGKQ
jgi:PAS domain S-box-containing protein